ncbi:MAG TPA: hypothetical protein VKW78_14765 [Terriglobales bacterium]|nr:hypothetical protein [Terriglobales bacterium]
MLLGSISRRHKNFAEGGYLYLALLLMVALLTFAMLAMAPSMIQQMKRDRENEMIHRGVQYARAVKKYYKKFGAYPTTIQQLENTNNIRFLRQRYKDPMNAKGEWRILHYGDVQLGASQFGTPGPGGTTGGVAANTNSSFGQSAFGQNSTFGQSSSFGQSSFGQSGSTFGSPSSANSSSTPATPNASAPSTGTPAGTGTGNSTSTSSTSGTDSSDTSNVQTTGSSSSGGSSSFGSSSFGSSTTGPNGGGTFGGGGILGVASLSPKASIHVFDEKNHYKDWRFIYDPTQDRGGLITGPYSTKAPLGFAGQGQVAPNGQQQPFQAPGGSGIGTSGSSPQPYSGPGGQSQQSSPNQMTPSMPPESTPQQ